jgi:hypothetical protein
MTVCRVEDIFQLILACRENKQIVMEGFRTPDLDTTV